MTAISANDTGLPARPVTTWDNEEVKGAALCADSVHADYLKRVNELRTRQADYRASLPTEPKEAIRAAMRAMHPKGESYPGAFEEAMHLSKAIRPMVEMLQTDDRGPDRDALLWIADRIAFGLEGVATKLDHISEILDTPGRIERTGTP